MAENESWALLFGEQRKNSESAMICLGGDLRPPQTALELAELRGGGTPGGVRGQRLAVVNPALLTDVWMARESNYGRYP